MTDLRTLPSYADLTPEQFFNEIAPAQKPIVIRGFAKHWPIVQAAKRGEQDFCQYLLQFYNGKKTGMVVAPPAANKRFHYNDDLTGVNFLQGEERIDLFLGRLLELIDRDVYPAISMQNTRLEAVLPGLAQDNPSTYFPDLPPRLWVGNEGIVSAHYDGSDNIACVVAGRRRFLLFPPDQTQNLYPGPINFTPAGAPTTLVDFNQPDHARFPLFKEALKQAYSVELGPGDALFIPMLWWHHIESLEKVNGLMNYWWNGSSAPDAVAPSAIDSLNIALLAMRNTSDKQRQAWRHMFNHYVFQQDINPRSYIPKHQQHILGEIPDDQVAQIQRYFTEKLTR
ncbi:cupin-like domain-containing protein [Alteromonas sediminis]|uniref:Cupin-like domain-containing protein n=1 Tax=Alteromonas sediminis TaxID=2259342 RepID=A0A3N5ZAC1_9ALTE|nr:cupin-like domain-containing protein [Alteromonas sediminis]RPJ68014.1 cupin-like domain-containing protein [Alteromonas sediminis]